MSSTSICMPNRLMYLTGLNLLFEQARLCGIHHQAVVAAQVTASQRPQDWLPVGAAEPSPAGSAFVFCCALQQKEEHSITDYSSIMLCSLIVEEHSRIQELILQQKVQQLLQAANNPLCCALSHHIPTQLSDAEGGKPYHQARRYRLRMRCQQLLLLLLQTAVDIAF